MKDYEKIIYIIIVTIIGVVGMLSVPWAFQYGSWRFIVPACAVFALLIVYFLIKRRFR